MRLSQLPAPLLNHCLRVHYPTKYPTGEDESALRNTTFTCDAPLPVANSAPLLSHCLWVHYPTHYPTGEDESMQPRILHVAMPLREQSPSCALPDSCCLRLLLYKYAITV